MSALWGFSFCFEMVLICLFQCDPNAQFQDDE